MQISTGWGYSQGVRRYIWNTSLQTNQLPIPTLIRGSPWQAGQFRLSPHDAGDPHGGWGLPRAMAVALRRTNENDAINAYVWPQRDTKVHHMVSYFQVTDLGLYRSIDSAVLLTSNSTTCFSAMNALGSAASAVGGGIHHLLTGSYTNTSLFLLAFDTAARTLTLDSTVPGFGLHQYVGSNADRDRIYATTMSEPPRIFSWSVEEDWQFTHLETVNVST